MDFEAVYKKYYNMICKYCYFKTGQNQFYAEEITSSVFLLMLEKWDQVKLRSEDDIRIWLYATARNKVFTFYREQKEQERIEEYDEKRLSHQIDGSMFDWNSEVRKYENYIQLIQAKLKPKDRELFNYVVVQKRTFKELAEIMHSNEKAVRMKWYRLQNKLRPLVTKILSEH